MWCRPAHLCSTDTTSALYFCAMTKGVSRAGMMPGHVYCAGWTAWTGEGGRAARAPALLPHLATDVQDDGPVRRGPEVVNDKVPLAPSAAVSHVEVVQDGAVEPVHSLVVLDVLHPGAGRRRGDAPAEVRGVFSSASAAVLHE